MTEYFFRTRKATYHPEGDNCGGDWLTHTAGSQCQMALLPDMVNHSVNPTITETYAMEEVQQHSFTNNNNSNSSSQSFTITTVPHKNQRLLHPRKNHFHQLRRTLLAMDRYPWEQQQQQDHHQMQDVATESSSCAGMMVALERTAAPQALERHRRKFLEYWDFG